MEEDIKKGKISMVVPFLIGGLVGAAAALLLAPKSGKELIKDMKDMADATGGKVTDTVVKGKALYDDGVHAVKEGIEAGKTAFVKELQKHRVAA